MAMSLDSSFELKKIDDNHYLYEMKIGETVLNNYARNFEKKLTAEILNRCERSLNELGWYKQTEQKQEPEQDSIEKIKADSTKTFFKYWNCINDCCDNCPRKIDGKTPAERYITSGCKNAMQLDIIERTMKVMESK